MAKKAAHLFPEVGTLGADILGGKGLGLAEMQRLGLPVPPGFILPSGISRAYAQEGQLPKRVLWHVQRAVGKLEKQTGKRFGDPINPLFLSVRSGAKISMPGMMDTILNLGINDETLMALAESTSDDFALDTGSRFQKMFYEITGMPAPENVWDQLLIAIEAVCKSWNNPRAVAYREANRVPHSLGTAIVVQSMVFGNHQGVSGSGVIFSRNITTGEPGVYGEWLPNMQGEDLVSGVTTPESLTSLAENHPVIWQQLTRSVVMLERHYHDVVDVEFTIEEGQLYFLQVRIAKRTPEAAVTIAVDLVVEHLIDVKTAVGRVTEDELLRLRRQEFDPSAYLATHALMGKGLPASRGAAVGRAVFSPEKAIALSQKGDSVVLIRPDTNPDDFAGMQIAKAIVTSKGGATSHAAVVARALGVPAVVSVSLNWIKNSFGDTMITYGSHGVLLEGDVVSVCGTTGQLFKGKLMLIQKPSSPKVADFMEWRSKLRPPPVVDFGLAQQKFNMNGLLIDYYLIKGLEHETAGTPLIQAVRQVSSQISSQIAAILVCYGIIAVAGEVRHSYNRSNAEIERPEFLAKLKGFGVNTSMSRSSAQDAVRDILQSCNLHKEFLHVAVELFGHTSWQHGDVYGGEKWALIAECLLFYMTGVLSKDLFIDRMFDLRHNGGKLFNKHAMVISTDDDYLSHQLDLKRRHVGNVLDLEAEFNKQARRYGYKTISQVYLLLREWETYKEAHQ